MSTDIELPKFDELSASAKDDLTGKVCELLDSKNLEGMLSFADNMSGLLPENAKKALDAVNNIQSMASGLRQLDGEVLDAEMKRMGKVLNILMIEARIVIAVEVDKFLKELAQAKKLVI